MEELGMTDGAWRGRRVFLTGHTGFKGGWLALRLAAAGARVHGYALAPPTEPSLHAVAKVRDVLEAETIGDIRDTGRLEAAMRACAPSAVFHLAAQPLVRRSYREPVETYAVNVMGTIHVLEAVRATGGVDAVVSVTTDKCYENREWDWAYRESEALGGHDPYSSSKACAEIATAAWRRSFLAEAGAAVATARAGNVIGGGDWAEDRLLPDFFRAADAGRSLEVRNPGAVRPWQHVLEPVGGYMALAERLLADGAAFAEAWNFGPSDEDAVPVGRVLDQVVAAMPGTSWRHVAVESVHEAGLLKLDSSKARRRLGWKPRWILGEALARTAGWHVAWRRGDDMQRFCLEQIEAHGRATPETLA